MRTKICTKCCSEKELNAFYKYKNGKLGRSPDCKACKKAYREQNTERISNQRKAHYKYNSDRIKERSKAYYNINKRKEKARNDNYRKCNSEKIRGKNKSWREQNADKISTWNKAYREENTKKVKDLQKNWRCSNPDKVSDWRKKWARQKYETDPIFKVKISLRGKTSRLGKYKSDKTIKIVGCSPKEFWEMNGSPSIEEMKNLHIDHIVPLSWFNLKNEDHVKVSSHYTNFQYIRSADNLKKKDTYAGSPDNIIGYKREFDIDSYVCSVIEKTF